MRRGSCENVAIKEMQINVDDDIVWVQTSGLETSLNCSPEASVFLKLSTATAGGKNAFDALLSAHTINKAITIRIQDNVSPCRIVYVRQND